MNTRQALALVAGNIALGASLALGFAMTPATHATPAAIAAPPAACEEDMPCWDCDTMGNRSCGPGGSESRSSSASDEAGPSGPGLGRDAGGFVGGWN